VRDDAELEKLIGQFKDQSNMLTSLQYMKLYGQDAQNMSNMTGNNTSNMMGNNTTNILGQTGHDVSGATNQFQILMAQKQEDQAVIQNLK